MQNTIAMLIHPEMQPDAIPSPEIFTAAIPPITALKYSAHKDNGVVTESGSEVEYAIVQNTSIRTTDEIAQAI